MVDNSQPVIDSIPVAYTPAGGWSHMIWEYVGLTARLEHLALSETDPAAIEGMKEDF